jgi:hypothetical protein
MTNSCTAARRFLALKTPDRLTVGLNMVQQKPVRLCKREAASQSGDSSTGSAVKRRPGLDSQGILQTSLARVECRLNPQAARGRVALPSLAMSWLGPPLEQSRPRKRLFYGDVRWCGVRQPARLAPCYMHSSIIMRQTARHACRQLYALIEPHSVRA